jgi:hypothetical protein
MTVVWAAAVVATTLTVGATPASAQAPLEDHAGHESSSRMERRGGAASVGYQAVASAPTTSPAAAIRYFTTTVDDPERPWILRCEAGYVCARVPYGSGWYIFKFYKYGTYTLYNWYGVGAAYNAQTGGAGANLLDRNGGLIFCLPSPPTDTSHPDWDPVYYVQLRSTSLPGC